MCCFNGCADTCLDSLGLNRPQDQFPFRLTEAHAGRRRLTETGREEEEDISVRAGGPGTEETEGTEGWYRFSYQADWSTAVVWNQ